MNAEVEKRLEALFGPADRDQARTKLIEQCGENIPGWKMAGLYRLHCAVLKLSDGELGKLQRAIDLAKIDLRDVLMAAGFGERVSAHESWWPEKKH
jgi:hypothetical protein